MVLNRERPSLVDDSDRLVGVVNFLLTALKTLDSELAVGPDRDFRLAFIQ